MIVIGKNTSKIFKTDVVKNIEKERLLFRDRKKDDVGMSDILDYVRTYGNETFLERHFSSADALVLAQLAYMDWSSAVPGLKENKSPITLKETLYVGDLEPMIRGSVFKTGNRELFFQTANSRRFGGIKLNYYVDLWNEDVNVQMSALTFLLPCGRACVTFRGTDESLNGWKESFSMVYRFPVPAQECAVMYLNQVGKKLNMPLIVCGHSKGGNLGVYAGACCEEIIRRRIRRIYNFDGPGFWDVFLSMEGYRELLPRIRKYVAPESFIGLLLKDDAATFMVECKSKGMRQHDPYQWQLFRGRLRKVYKYHCERRRGGEKLNSHILTVSKEQCQNVIDSFFQAAADSGLQKLPELNKDYTLEVLKKFSGNCKYDREALFVFARLMIYMLPGRKILR